MVPLLLLLLLPGAPADRVCFNISDGVITTIMENINLTVRDFVGQPGHMRCWQNGSPCIFQCTSINSLQFNGSSACFQVGVSPDGVAVSIEQYYNCSLYSCNNPTLLWLIDLLEGESSYQENMMHLIYFRDSCPLLFSQDRAVTEAFISTERQIIHHIMQTSELVPGGSVDYSLKSLSLHVVNISEAELNSTDTRIQIKAPQLLPQNQSSIPDVWLPVDNLQSIPQESRVVGLVTYMHHSQFQFRQEEISSMVLRIELLGQQPFRNLKTPIKMTFQNVPPTDMDNDSWLQCNYFDEHDLQWKADGCETIVNPTKIICNCNHSTPFAVLLMRDPISEVHWKILSIISYIGCGLSAFFTALSLVIYVFSRKRKMDFSISIHVSLSGALFLLNATFLLTEWGATVEPDWVCVFVAALMHYSLLCCFTWMAIEALHLYLLLIKVFNTYFKHYLAKLSLAGWGIPGVIVAVSLGVKDFKQFYGVTQMTVADTNQTNGICWITDDSFFYSMNLVYFTLIFAFNTGILIAVVSNICKMKREFRSSSKPGAGAEGATQGDPLRFGETCRSGLTVMGLTCLMGTTWGLAFLGSGYINYPILYLFCILNSTQGFFIFLWICLAAKKQRKRDMEERMTSTPVKTSGVKFDETAVSPRPNPNVLTLGL
ncbi:adhesion G-protein coupled receptor G5 [Cebidichthys violaceus]|uniref:adhesion G-protein coupled receptor G5 n=1 Tax=Cebidichthys violaceus TaxID=271503 RepID=UPI0035C9A7F3